MKLSSVQGRILQTNIQPLSKSHWTLPSAQDNNAAAAPIEKAVSDTEASEKSETEKLPPVMPELVADKSSE